MPEDLMGALRDHGADTGRDWTPARRLTGAAVCDHAGFGPVRIAQTTGSMISHLAADVQTHFVTGTAAPCTSIFKPVWLGSELPAAGLSPTNHYDEATLFWRHEALHRATLCNYPGILPLYASERDALERQFVKGAMTCRDRTAGERADYTAACFATADEAEVKWRKRVAQSRLPDRRPLLYASAWRSFDAAAGKRDRV